MATDVTTEEALESDDLLQDEMEAVEKLAEARDAIVEQVRKRIYGQDELIEHLLVAIFARGHTM